MMRKKFIMILLFGVTFCSLFFISTGKETTAKECNDCDQISTAPGDAEFPDNWQCTCVPYTPMTLNVTYDPQYPDTIKCGHDVTINVLDGCAPFTWGDPGNGYTWVNGEVDPENPKIKKTNERSNILQCAPGT